MFKFKVIPHTLHFKQPAGTSRGIYTERKVWYVELSDTEDPIRKGIGECAPLHDLSCDYTADYERVLADFASCAENELVADNVDGHIVLSERMAEDLRYHPSMLLDLKLLYGIIQPVLPNLVIRLLLAAEVASVSMDLCGWGHLKR